MLPEYWDYNVISDYAHPTDKTVQTGPFGAQLHSEDYVEEGIPFILIKNMKGPHVDRAGMPCITEHDAERLSAYRLKEGDIVFSRVGRVGSCFLVTNQEQGWVISGQLLRMRLDYSRLIPRFLIHWIRSTYLERHISNESVGSTRQSINSSILSNLPVPAIQKDEQEIIAQILDSLDTQIQKTEALIAKLEKIKEGLLHDLLTRGIDQNGQLRPSPEQAPELYKESTLGLIPKDWQVSPLKAVLTSIDQGWSPACVEEPSNGDDWAVLKTSSITWRGYNWQENKILPSHLKPKPDYEVAPDDILITRAGPKERVGVVAWVESTPSRLMISDKIYRLRSDREVVTPFYLAQQLSLFNLQHQLRKTISGMADSQTNISQSTLAHLSIPIPGLGEQELVNKRIRSLNERITREHEINNKLLKQKIGLMDDLLTGHVRVTSLLKDAV